jgi:hypothetical protein
MPPILGFLLLLCASAHPAIGQQTQSQPNASSQLRPVSLPHLYWHFLVHQSELDAFAAKLDAQGQAEGLRNDLQTQLGFSDADYAPIRTSSQRLAAELQPVEAQLTALQGSAWNPSQVQALIAQREGYIGNEVQSLSTELSAKNKATLEAFMTQFFAPKSASATNNGQAVQQ